MEEHLTPSDDPGQEDAGAESSPDADPTLALLGQYVRDHWTHAAPAKKCVVSPWDPTCSGKPFRPARPSFPDLERSFPGLERYLHKHRQDKGGYKDALRQMIDVTVFAPPWNDMATPSTPNLSRPAIASFLPCFFSPHVEVRAKVIVIVVVMEMTMGLRERSP